MADHLQATFDQLTELAKVHSRVAVGFSGGKDSLTTLDLAVKHFETVIPYFYYFVPGLKHEESRIAIAKERYGLTVLKYPSAEGLDALRMGLYCDERAEFDALPVMNRRRLFDWIKVDTKATLILTGEKKADGMFRRRAMSNQKKTLSDVFHPLADWLKTEVPTYLKSQGIELPDPGRGDNGGTSLLNQDVLFMYHNHREDYQQLRRFFPYIETIVLTERWFGGHA